jgi:hypothetical protein
VQHRWISVGIITQVCIINSAGYVILAPLAAKVKVYLMSYRLIYCSDLGGHKS